MNSDAINIKASIDEINTVHSNTINSHHYTTAALNTNNSINTKMLKDQSVGTSNGNACSINTIQLSNDEVVIHSVHNSDENISLNGMSRLELDSHANMPVVGASAHILSKSGETVDVNAYSPDYEPKKVPLVDTALRYECPYNGTTHILIIRNALYVPSMDNHLIPPFIMREAGIQVNEVPKIHQDDVDVSDHSIYFSETDFRMPLSLTGVFSYLPVSTPSVETLNSCEDIYLLTPTTWNLIMKLMLQMKLACLIGRAI